MPKELRKMLLSISKNDFITSIVLFLTSLLLGKYKYGAILLIGNIVSMLNFILSALIINMFFKNLKKNKSILFFLSYLIRIIIVAFIALFFSKNLSYILTFLTGFFTHYIVLVITTIKVQKGSE